jgi:hypothetical protein
VSITAARCSGRGRMVATTTTDMRAPLPASEDYARHACGARTATRNWLLLLAQHAAGSPGQITQYLAGRYRREFRSVLELRTGRRAIADHPLSGKRPWTDGLADP